MTLEKPTTNPITKFLRIAVSSLMLLFPGSSKTKVLDQNDLQNKSEIIQNYFDKNTTLATPKIIETPEQVEELEFRKRDDEEFDTLLRRKLLLENEPATLPNLDPVQLTKVNGVIQKVESSLGTKQSIDSPHKSGNLSTEDTTQTEPPFVAAN